MENFEQFEEPKVKEKNIYLLHLDKARIAILSSIIIGIVAIALLIGMKINGKDKIAEDDLFTTNNINSGTLTSPSDINDLFESKPAENQVSVYDPAVVPTETNPITVTKPETDVLTADNINMVPAAVNNADTISAKPVSPKTSSKNQVKAVAVNPKKTTSNTAVKSVKNNNVKNVTVSSRVSNNKTVTSTAVQKKITEGFSLQVASYDNYSRAKLESDTLKKQNYETYINDAYVNGINYYRVRIGPYSERFEAASVLDKLQTDSKYAESYIVKE